MVSTILKVKTRIDNIFNWLKTHGIFAILMSLRSFVLVAIIIVTLACVFSPAWAQSLPASGASKRVAWVVGNSTYKGEDRLRNPVVDAEMIANNLRSIGFRVLLDTNLSLEQLKDRLSHFANVADGSEIALVFYAGHGLAVNGINYLIPIDQRPAALTSDGLQRSGLSLAAVEARLRASNVKTIALIADACRQSPIRGVAPSGFTTPKVSKAVLYFFSTLPGGLARDGSGEHSPFAQAFHEGLRLYPHSLQKIIEYTQADVDASTGGTQIPWVGSGLVGDVSLLSADRIKLSTSADSYLEANSRRRSASSQGAFKQSSPGTIDENEEFWSYYLTTVEHQVHYVAKTHGVKEVPELRKRALMGDTLATAALAFMYMGDPGKTIRSKGVPLGGPVPLMDLIYNPNRTMERLSDPVKPNLSRAANYARQCSVKGNIVCQTLLGEMYISGVGVNESITKGRDLIKRSASAGHVRAQQDLIWLQARDGAIDPNALFSGIMTAIGQHKASFDAQTEYLRP